MEATREAERGELYPVSSYCKLPGDPNSLETQLRIRACFLACKHFNIPPHNYLERHHEKVSWNSTNMNLLEKINPEKYLMVGYMIYGEIGKNLTFHAREGTDPTVAIANDKIEPIWEDQKIKTVFDETINGLAALWKISRIDLEFAEIKVINWSSPASNGSPSLGFEIICKITRSGKKQIFRTVDEKIYMLNNENLGTYIPLPRPISPAPDADAPSRIIGTPTQSSNKWSLPWPFKKEKK